MIISLFFFQDVGIVKAQEKINKYFKMLSAEFFTQTAMALSNNILLGVWIMIARHLDRLVVQKHRLEDDFSDIFCIFCTT